MSFFHGTPSTPSTRGSPPGGVGKVVAHLSSKIFEQVGCFQWRGGVKFIGGIEVVEFIKKMIIQVVFFVFLAYFSSFI